jgi:hypothetical protein
VCTRLDYNVGGYSVPAEKIRRGRELDAPSPARPQSSIRYGSETDVASPELVIVKVPVVDEA